MKKSCENVRDDDINNRGTCNYRLSSEFEVNWVEGI